MIFHKEPAELRLEIQGRSYTFATPHDLEFALQGRTDVSSGRARRYFDVAPNALRHEAISMREVEKRFAQALAESGRGENDIGGFLGGLDLAVISKDHGWREIMKALNRTPGAPEAYRKVALVKYMQYLAARQQMLEAVHADRLADAPAGGSLDEDHGVALGETLVFGPAEMPAAVDTRRLRRIPKGETVESCSSRVSGWSCYSPRRPARSS